MVVILNWVEANCFLVPSGFSNKELSISFMSNFSLLFEYLYALNVRPTLAFHFLSQFSP